MAQLYVTVSFYKHIFEAFGNKNVLLVSSFKHLRYFYSFISQARCLNSLNKIFYMGRGSEQGQKLSRIIWITHNGCIFSNFRKRESQYLFLVYHVCKRIPYFRGQFWPLLKQKKPFFSGVQQRLMKMEYMLAESMHGDIVITTALFHKVTLKVYFVVMWNYSRKLC